MLAQNAPRVDPAKPPEVSDKDQILWLQIQLKSAQTYMQVRQQFGKDLDANDKAQSDFLSELKGKCGAGFTPNNSKPAEPPFVMPLWSCMAVPKPADRPAPPAEKK